MKRPFPELTDDKAAEDLVDSTDLSDYDFSDMVPVRFELRRKDKSVSLRLPESLLDAVRARAEQAGMPTQRFMRLAIERALLEPVSR
ncbi:CopG family antitoxin [Methylobacterium sp. NFXW15]|uniref:CopG family antitoxin n=1 Tax=Methylobacterium sp. NFXW15 TaxID=2819512 RepID=UPI003CF7A4D6